MSDAVYKDMIEVMNNRGVPVGGLDMRDKMIAGFKARLG